MEGRGRKGRIREGKKEEKEGGAKGKRVRVKGEETYKCTCNYQAFFVVHHHSTVEPLLHQSFYLVVWRFCRRREAHSIQLECLSGSCTVDIVQFYHMIRLYMMLEQHNEQICRVAYLA